jgi:superfamily II DNA or RNA helicase
VLFLWPTESATVFLQQLGRPCRNADDDKRLGHTAGVLDAHAEPERAYRPDMGDLVVQVIKQDAAAGIIAGGDPFEFGQIVAAASLQSSRPFASGLDDRRCTDNVPPGHDKRRPITDVRRQNLQVDRVGPRRQMFDELEVGHEVNITARIGIPSRHQVGCRCWPPAQ